MATTTTTLTITSNICENDYFSFTSFKQGYEKYA